MYFEYCNYNKYIEDYEKELSQIFRAIDNNIGGLALPIHMVNEVKEFIPEGIVLSTSIDYPCGYTSDKVRNHMVLNALKCGINAIDYVPNQYLLRHKWKDMVKEISVHRKMCQDHGATFRMFLDYRYTSNIVSLAKRVSKMGVEIVYPTIGYHHDDFFDNLINARLISKKTSLSVIFNGYIWKKDQLDMVMDCNLFGVRLYNLDLWCK